MYYSNKVIGVKVKEYGGVAIYVDQSGVFYADPKNNSADFNEKIFHSTNISSVERAIDAFKNTIEGGKEFWEIVPHTFTFKKIKVVANVGNLLFFDDGTNTKNQPRHKLYPEEVVGHSEFQNIQLDMERGNEINRQIEELYTERKALIDRMNKTLQTIQSVKPMV